MFRHKAEQRLSRFVAECPLQRPVIGKFNHDNGKTAFGDFRPVQAIRIYGNTHQARNRVHHLFGLGNNQSVVQITDGARKQFDHDIGEQKLNHNCNENNREQREKRKELADTYRLAVSD